MSVDPDDNVGRHRAGLSPGRLAEIACLLEVTARKPGNVHRGADFEHLHFVDFLLSAAAIAGPLDRAEAEGVGTAVLAAVESTRRVVSTNTNLGMILLLAPLAAVPIGIDLAWGVERVLAGTTVEDASLVYRAIRLASAGGMGRADEQDVADEPTVTLREAMTLAADRDLIARQYAGGYREVLHEVLPSLKTALAEGQPLETAIVTAYLASLSRYPDSLIARKKGMSRALEVTNWAAGIITAGWPATEESRSRCAELDAWLRRREHQLNPGTTADLVTAALFAALREGTIVLPRPDNAASWSSVT